MAFPDDLESAADYIAALTLAAAPTYVELTDGSAGLVSQVTVEPPGPATVRILITSLSEQAQSEESDPEITYERKANSPEQTYATATLSKVALAKRPPNG
jgi:hypothetical protein